MLSVFSSLQKELRKVEEVMAASLQSTEPRVSSLLEDLGEFHGKMLRPSLVLLVSACLDSPSEKR